MNQRSIERLLEQLQIFLLGFVVTSKVIIRYCSFHGYASLADILGSKVLYLLILVSIMLVITRVHYLKVASVGVVSFLCLYMYQILIVSPTNLSAYWSTFFITGFSGLVCGLVAKNIRKLINVAGFFSVLYGLVLIPEPFTKGILGYTSMNLGYTLAPLCIWLLMFWYINRSRLKMLILFEFVVLSIITILFTSRGCGLALISAIVFLYVIDGVRKGRQISKRFFAIVASVIAAYVVLTQVAIKFVERMGVSLFTGSLLSKMINGVAADSNGRDTILQNAIELIKEHPLLGVGIAQDRVIIGYVFPHNIIVEIFLHFGIIFGLIILFMYWKTVAKGIKESLLIETAFFIPLLCSIYWIRLFFSDSYLDNMFGLMLILGYALQVLYNQRRGNEQIYE